MKKILLLALVVSTLISCGGDKKKEVTTDTETKATDKYKVEIEATYEKDDSIVLFYQIDNFFQYEKPVSLKIKGSPMMQKFTIDLPENIAAENIKITASTNKEQENLTVKNITVKNDKLVLLDGDNGKQAQYFLTDESFTWDPKTSRYKLDHTKKYPPSFVGNEKALGALAK